MYIKWNGPDNNTQSVCKYNAPINVKPQRGKGGGGWGIYGGFDRSLSPRPREFDPYFRPEGGDI